MRQALKPKPFPRYASPSAPPAAKPGVRCANSAFRSRTQAPTAAPTTTALSARLVITNLPSPEQVAGARIREIRIAHHWTQATLAKRMRTLGYKWLQTTAAKTEAAERPLRLNEAADLARVLGVDVCDLLETGPVSVPAPDPRVIAAEAMLRVADELTAVGKLLEVTDDAGLTDG